MDPLEIWPDFDEAAELRPIVRLENVLAAVAELPIPQQESLTPRSQVRPMGGREPVEQKCHGQHVGASAPPGPRKLNPGAHVPVYLREREVLVLRSEEHTSELQS